MMTSTQIAEAKGVSVRAVRKWCAAGKRGGVAIIAYQMGRDWLVAAELCDCGRVVFFQNHTLRATCDCGCDVRYVGPFGE